MSLQHDPNKPILISFSGGRTSAFMVHYFLTNAKYHGNPKVFLFANTGKEREETLKFIHECDTRWGMDLVWLEPVVSEEFGEGTSFKIVTYETAARNGEPFEQVIQKYGIPNQAFPHCTRELKERPLHKYMKSLGYDDYYTAVGIRGDEKSRINLLKMREQNFIYPLATEFIVNKDFIRKWWDNQPFDLQLKDYEGNCDLCWKKSKRKKLTIIKENPAVADWWVKMESEHQGSGNREEGEYYFHRGHESTSDLIEQSKQKFWTVQDEWEVRKQQMSAFDEDMDLEFDCFCKAS